MNERLVSFSDEAADEIARAVGGEGAVELEAAAPLGAPPASPAGDFEVRSFTRLPAQTAEEIEEIREELNGPKHFTSHGTPVAYGQPTHTGGKRRRSGSGPDA